MTKILKSINTWIRTLLYCVLFVSLLSMCSLAEANGPEKNSALQFNPATYSKFMRPMKDIVTGRNYCSSSSVKYKGQVLTITNRHCCDAKGGLTGERRVGNSIETIVHVSQLSDICILTSSQKNTVLTVAKRDFKKFDKAIIIGYPLGMYQSFSEGRFLLKKKACVDYGTYKKKDVRCVISNISSADIYPGNSGSPVLNNKGQITNVAYAGPRRPPFHAVSTTLSQLKLALDVAVLEVLDGNK